jgi:hypothetical protein
MYTALIVLLDTVLGFQIYTNTFCFSFLKSPRLCLPPQPFSQLAYHITFVLWAVNPDPLDFRNKSLEKPIN